MRFDLKLETIPAGYSMESARGGEKVSVLESEFTSSEDGDIFISRLEGWPSGVLAKLPPEIGIRPENADWFVCSISPDATASIWVRDVPITLEIRAKRTIEKGDDIFLDDIANVRRLKFMDVQIPPEAGVAVLMSVGWRKGFYYDFGPIGPSKQAREYDLEVLLGQLYAYLSFQHFYKISEKEWDKFISQQWYPFITLDVETIKKMIAHIRAGWQVNDLLPEIAKSIEKSSEQNLARWKGNIFFEPHYEVLEHALRLHLEGDYVSSTSIFFTRIEGVIRTCNFRTRQDGKINQQTLVSTVTDNVAKEDCNFNLLMPLKFKRFLEEVYFADFKPGQPTLISRHSVAHGVASSNDFTLKSSVLAILILDQIFFHLVGLKTKEL